MPHQCAHWFAMTGLVGVRAPVHGCNARRFCQGCGLPHHLSALVRNDMQKTGALLRVQGVVRKDKQKVGRCVQGQGGFPSEKDVPGTRLRSCQCMPSLWMSLCARPKFFGFGLDKQKSVAIIFMFRGCSSSGRAPPCQGGGSEFEPRHPLHIFGIAPTLVGAILFYIASRLASLASQAFPAGTSR